MHNILLCNVAVRMSETFDESFEQVWIASLAYDKKQYNLDVS
jgi:hypothetical protein